MSFWSFDEAKLQYLKNGFGSFAKICDHNGRIMTMKARLVRATHASQPKGSACVG